MVILSKLPSYQGSFSVMSYVSLQLFSEKRMIFLWSLGVICFDRWGFREGLKNKFKDWCHSLPFLIFVSFSWHSEMTIISELLYYQGSFSVMFCMKVSVQLFSVVWMFSKVPESPWVSCVYWQSSYQWGSVKLVQGLFHHELSGYPFLIFTFFWLHKMVISKVCKPDNFESH